MQPQLTEYARAGVTLLGDSNEPQGVTLAFTERTGGVSSAPYASLNLATHVADKNEAVQENRRRVLKALGAEALLGRLLVPNQVHGTHVAVLRDGSDSALEACRRELADGADAVVCTTPGVPVLLCFADCVPVIVVAPGGFAVVHSGWKGTFGRILERAIATLCSEVGCAPQDVLVYVGPHIRVQDYEVSPELAAQFEAAFGAGVVRRFAGAPHLDLSFALHQSMRAAGVPEDHVAEVLDSTASNTHKFYSYRAEGGTCGRHAAVALLKEV